MSEMPLYAKAIALNNHLAKVKKLELEVNSLKAILANQSAQVDEAVAPAGYRLMWVAGFDELMEAMFRADAKGYMPHAVQAHWEAFNYREAATNSQGVVYTSAQPTNSDNARAALQAVHTLLQLKGFYQSDDTIQIFKKIVCALGSPPTGGDK